MLTEVVRKSMERCNNRFELVVLAAERCRQLLAGARPVVENPGRERLMKVAMRELVEGRIHREGDGWKVDRPALPELQLAPAPVASAADILGLHDEEEDADADADDEEE